ncbi:hypothetical protein [Tritonibacter scottomollicae]|uniref:Uncharacterized protein n=1 Tax=Tritonibacter scottomollicae TaxID=483013 RepID=A0A2T1AHG5_TRISK|nr:hypothetical protein [Tritonibacter scottomollicae]PRZ47996.1 hypothetical protein CLV89_105221 [Tritonibacter scottomollicae]
MIAPPQWEGRQLRKQLVRSQNEAIRKKRLEALKKRIAEGKKKGAA